MRKGNEGPVGVWLVQQAARNPEIPRPFFNLFEKGVRPKFKT